MDDYDLIIKQINNMKLQIQYQQNDIEILNKKIDQLLEEIDYRELNKNVNLI